MSEVSGRLARELRDFYDRIERRRLPASLVNPDLNATKRGRRARAQLTTIAGFAAVVVAAGAFLVVGLASHHSSTSRLPAGGATGGVAGSPTPSATPSPTGAATPSPSAPSGPTAGWPLITNTSGGFSLRYPTGWQIDGPCTVVGRGLFFPLEQGPVVEVRLGPTATASCGTEVYDHVGVVVDSYIAASPPVGAPGPCVLVNRQGVTIGGVSGTRVVTSPNPSGPSCGAGAVTSIEYSFQVGQRVFLVSYYQFVGDPDLIPEIDTIMTQTWSFQLAG